jgi:uncharacterized Fe-S cluster-containing radical SAM superfamily protein
MKALSGSGAKVIPPNMFEGIVQNKLADSVGCGFSCVMAWKAWSF